MECLFKAHSIKIKSNMNSYNFKVTVIKQNSKNYLWGLLIHGQKLDFPSQMVSEFKNKSLVT